ncbi:unnamed protein product [Angiostrongylus costaricensis]|uniref:Uncharacterized protein n=1 Tax=Angiostrongylus costaricensis TaxID=334426 RepID=A0A0R3PDV9_ANGCS|nr:unnamed protein product [Angiostrongylus costaricensis]
MPYVNDKHDSLRLRRSVSKSSASDRRGCMSDDNAEYQSDDSEYRLVLESLHTGGESVSFVAKKADELVRGRNDERRSGLTERKTHNIPVDENSSCLNSSLFGNINLLLFTVIIVLVAFYISIIWRSDSFGTVISVESIRKKLQDFEAHLSESMGKFENVTGDDIYTLYFVGRQSVISSFIALRSDVPIAVLNGIDQLFWDAPLVLQAFSDNSFVPSPHTLLLLSVKKSFLGPKKVCEQSLME